MRTVLRLIERGRIPTGLVRLGLRHSLRQRLREEGERFGRVVSVEMLEHVRTWEPFLAKMSHWITAEARVFIHVFARDRYPDPLEGRG